MRSAPSLVLMLTLSTTGIVSTASAQDFESEGFNATADVFADSEQALREGRKTIAADLLMEIADDPSQVQYRAEAYARLGNVFLELDLPYSALIAIEQAMQIDSEAVASSAKIAIELADTVGDTSLLEEVFAQNVGLDVDAATRSRMAYLAAREAQRGGNYGTSLAILTMVRDSDPFFAEAMSLYGVVLTLQDRPTDAIKNFQTALRLGEEKQKGDRFRNIVLLNLARAYYTAENFPRAIEHYAMVDRNSRQWAEAQFERAWAHFRLQDMNGALGLLHDHQGPFFEDAYFPEAYLLRIHSLFMMCKFPEASEQIDSFQERYRPQLEAIRSAAILSPEDFFAQMRTHVETGSSDLPPMVSWRFEGEDRFLDSLTAVQHAEDEMDRLRKRRTNPFSLQAMKWVQNRRDAIIQAEGLRMRGRVGLMQDKLQQMLDDSEMSKLDIMQLETRLYQVASQTGKMPDAKRTVSRKLKTKRGYRYWPYDGEFWADEAGYYRVNARPDCPTGLQTGE